MTVANGPFYLAAVCPSNILGAKANTTIQTEPFDLQAATSEVAALRDSYRKQIEVLTDPTVLWPETVKADVATIAEGTYGNLAGAANVAGQTTRGQLYFGLECRESSADAAATAQKIRLKLGLASDTTSSCTPG